MLIKWFKAGAVAGLIFSIIGFINTRSFDWISLFLWPALGGFGFVALRKWIFGMFWV